MKDFRKLKVWEKAHHLTLCVYKMSKGFPSEELYGLRSQIRRAASSIPSNIAEGCCRSSDMDFARYLQIALGSASELEYQILLSGDLEYIKNSDYDNLHVQVVEVKQMLTSFIQRLKADR